MTNYAGRYEVWIIAPNRSECVLRTDARESAVARCEELGLDRFYDTHDHFWEIAQAIPSGSKDAAHE